MLKNVVIKGKFYGTAMLHNGIACITGYRSRPFRAARPVVVLCCGRKIRFAMQSTNEEEEKKCQQRREW